MTIRPASVSGFDAPVASLWVQFEYLCPSRFKRRPPQALQMRDVVPAWWASMSKGEILTPAFSPLFK